MELIMFVALIFMLWLLVQLGVGIYHQGLRRGLRRWVRGLPHLISVALVSMLKVIPMLIAGITERANRRATNTTPLHTQQSSENFGRVSDQYMYEYLNLGYPSVSPFKEDD